MVLEIVMTMAGTFPLLGYMFCKRRYGRGLSAQFYIYLLRLAVIFSLLPFQYFKYYLPDALLKKTDFHVYWDVMTKKIFGHDYFSIPAGKNSYIYIAKPFLALCLCWFAVAVILFFYRYGQYFLVRKRLMNQGVNESINAGLLSDDDAHIPLAVKKYIRKKSPDICYSPHIQYPCTIGWIAPCIHLSDKKIYSSQEKKWICAHEITHMIHRDILWKSLCVFCCIIHWYNPLAYYLFYQYNEVCEYYCDETCMKQASVREKKAYAALLVREAVKKGTPFGVPVQYLSIGGEKMKKRIDWIFHERKQNRKYAPLLIAGCMVIGSSLTVFAYNALPEDTEPLEENAYYFNSFEEQPFIEEEEEEETYDYQRSPLWFTDEAGNREPVAEKDLSDQQGKSYAECKHSPKEGTLRQHIPLKNGGCEIRKYKASRCAKCGKILKKTLIQTIRNVKCTHK